MMNYELLNVAVFFVGLASLSYAGVVIVQNYGWVKLTPWAGVIIALLADDIIDNICTLVFALNTLNNIRAGIDGKGVNAISEGLAIGLRLCIFLPTFWAIRKTQVAANKEHQRVRETVAGYNTLREHLGATDDDTRTTGHDTHGGQNVEGGI